MTVNMKCMHIYYKIVHQALHKTRNIRALCRSRNRAVLEMISLDRCLKESEIIFMSQIFV